MPARITKIEIFNQFRNESVDFLLANVGDPIRIEHTIEINAYVVASNDEPFLLNASNGLPAGTGWCRDDSSRFTDFRVGDTVLYYRKSVGISSLGTFTIVDKLDDSTIKFDRDFSLTPKDCEVNDVIFSVSTPITALKYKWNFIENGESPNFVSKIDGSDHELVVKNINAASATVLPMIFIGPKTYQIGSATAQGVSIVQTSIYTSNFKIIHYTKVTPYMLSADWADLISGVNASYFQSSACLKAIFDIKGASDYNNPNWILQESITEVLGNTGGYGENFNSSLTNYSIDGLVFTDPNTNPLPAIDLSTDETHFEFSIKNTVDAPFVNNSTKFELQFIKAPYRDSEYTGNTRTVDENFLDDRVFRTVGGGVGNGVEYGVANRQVLKDVKAVFVSTSEIKVSGTISMLTGVISILNESQEPRYIITVAVQKHSLTTKLADLVRLPVHVSKFHTSVVDDGLVGIDNVYFRHYDSAQPGEGVALNMVIAPEDEVVSYSKFFVDRTGRSADDIKIISVEAKIKAKNAVTGEEFTLDNVIIPFAGTTVVNNNQFINFSLDRPFLIPSAEIRKAIKLNRRIDLDDADKAFYEIYFPFLVRWDYWSKLLQVNNEFFDTTQPSNGENHNWFRYSTFADWGIYYALEVVMDKNGTPLTYDFENKLDFYDYDSNPGWDPNTIKSFDPSTMTELVDPVSGTQYLMENEDTLVQADFTKVAGAPNMADMVVNMHIEIFEQGGPDTVRRMSSAWPSDGNTWFKSIDVSTKTILSLVGADTVRAEVLIDKSLIPANAEFSIQARLYEKPGPFVCVCPDGYVFDPLIMACKKVSGGSNVKRGNIWYFGIEGGIDFNTLDSNNNPLPLTDGPFATLEGCTAISNDDGELLFTSDGVKLYDGQLTEVANDLKGGISSTQSAVAVLIPGTADSFMLFTVDSDISDGTGHNYGLNYSVLSGVSHAGLTIDSKNNLLYSGAIEKLCARKNLDGSYWILSKEYNNSVNPNFVAFLLGADGVLVTTPVLSPASVHSGSGNPKNAGQIKFSPDGKKLVDCKYTSAFELYDFDEVTGIVSGGITLTGIRAYGAEFSANSLVLYMSDDQSTKLTQFDLTALDINSSRYAVGPPSAPRVGSIQLAPNGKMYVALASGGSLGANYLGVIDSPDTLGAGCGYNELMMLNGDPKGLYDRSTHTRLSFIGLPTFDLSNIVESQIVPCAGACTLPNYTVEALCPGKIKIVMVDKGGRSWVVTDNKGTAPKVITSNLTYLFGTYATDGPVQLTLTDSRRPECKVSQVVNIDCI